MIRAVVLTLLFCWGIARAQEMPSEVRASISSGSTPWVGQKVVLTIQLVAPGYFASTPHFDFPQIPGVILIPPEGRPVLGSETINGKSCITQQYDIALFARRDGNHEIPPFKIRFSIKRSALDKDEVPQEVETPRLMFTAKYPPGTENMGAPICARHLQAVEKWQPDVMTGKVGDAFTRTITYTASEIPGMAFSPFPATKVEGLGMYPKPPVVSDNNDRGTLTGQRTDTCVYVCEQPGRFVVPAVQLTWWSMSSQSLETIQFPERVFDITPNVALPVAPVVKAPLIALRHISKTAMVIGLIGAMLLMIRLVNLWKKRHQILGALRPLRLGPLNPIPPK